MTPTPVMQLDRSRQASPQLYELLRRQIIALELTPGTVLSRAELAGRFGVSQTPVREALLKLAQEKLVDIYPQALTRVSLIDIASAMQAHFLRRAVELELLHELASAPSPTLIMTLQATIEQQKTALAAAQPDVFNDADMAFHRALYQHAAREALWHLVHSQSGHLDRLRRLHLPVAGKQATIIAEHELILDAIERKDAGQAGHYLRTHLSGTMAYIRQIQLDHPQWVIGQPERNPAPAL
ncbi:GntR family transcriptional regulator [Advenella kashmirensis]|nr:GntR family transcriptional regulator [Advenella kashmirensis]